MQGTKLRFGDYARNCQSNSTQVANFFHAQVANVFHAPPRNGLFQFHAATILDAQCTTQSYSIMFLPTIN